MFEYFYTIQLDCFEIKVSRAEVYQVPEMIPQASNYAKFVHYNFAASSTGGK